MFQNHWKTLVYTKIWSTKFPVGGGGGGEVNHTYPVAYLSYFSYVYSSLEYRKMPLAHLYACNMMYQLSTRTDV